MFERADRLILQTFLLLLYWRKVEIKKMYTKGWLIAGIYLYIKNNHRWDNNLIKLIFSLQLSLINEKAIKTTSTANSLTVSFLSCLFLKILKILKMGSHVLDVGWCDSICKRNTMICHPTIIFVMGCFSFFFV